MTRQRIGLIGGLSWESTATYYRALNEGFRGASEWSQPPVLVDSLDFAEVVQLQQRGDWTATGQLLADSARRLELAGATVVAICANTMHINIDDVRQATPLPVVDVRDAVAREALASGHERVALLGTRYLLDSDFYSNRLEELGVSCVRPTARERDELQRIIFDELTVGVVTDESRALLRGVATSCLARGATVVGLCCTEFGLLIDEDDDLPVIDSTLAHVRALLNLVR